MFYKIDRNSHEANLEELRIRDRESEYDVESIVSSSS
jgi:hypothetical protein